MEMKKTTKKGFFKNLLAKNWIQFKLTTKEAQDITKTKGFENLNIVLYEDPEFHFREYFDKEDGLWITGDCKDGSSPFRRSFPSLLDIGIMGHCPNGKAGICAKAGIQCYQNAPNSCKPNMTFENYKYSQENFEKLYKQRFEKDKAYMRSVQYNKEMEKKNKK